ncbi:MAG TPA: mechanosensitive ion channel family protein [Rhizomicrobium sp.]|jgi:small-conductance mechanosensitive channel|nr:mechanosensitive ion channel family protein [Rhizomicrobium sp.]
MQALVHAFSASVAWAPRWLVAVTAFALIVAAGFVAQAIALRLVSERAKGWNPLIQLAFLRTRPVARFAAIVLAVAVALPLAPLSKEGQQSGHAVLVAAFIALVGWMALVAANLFMDRYVGSLRLDVADNLTARKAMTQMKIVRRAVNILICLATLGLSLMTFDTVRQFGVSLFASAGLAGLIAGLAARPVLENVIAGIQLALTQPIRIGDAVVIADEWGWIEEITSTYVVVKLWDWRRLIVPLTYLFQNPFANWTRSSSSIIGTVYIYADYTLPVARLRARAEEIARASRLWDGQIVNVQVSDAREQAMQVRILVSAKDSPTAWDLRCEMREKLIDFLQREFPGALPKTRSETRSLTPGTPAVAVARDLSDGAG